MTLPSDAADRKALPITTGVLDYFPDALAAVAEVSRIGNDQHNPGQPLHWAKEKSTDHADCITRHLIERGTIDTDGGRHSAKVAWRALALLQTEIEAEHEESFRESLLRDMRNRVASEDFGQPFDDEEIHSVYQRDIEYGLDGNHT